MIDIIFGLQWGDEGKGKCCAALIKSNNYQVCARWAGGNNAGHTVYVNGSKYKTHIIPSGVFHNTLSYIGPGCVLHPESFLKEIEYLNKNGFDTSLVRIDPKTHIVKKIHIQLDQHFHTKKQGSTSRGIAPCYSTKYNRKGTLAQDIKELNPFIEKIDFLNKKTLCEGAQGALLDIDYGNYPYVTSSTTLPYGACSLGFPPTAIKTIFGIAKCYSTRSGIDPNFKPPEEHKELLNQLTEIGEEYGVTTGRRRAVNWLNLDLLRRTIRITGTNTLIINKWDCIEKLPYFFIKYNNIKHRFSSIDDAQTYINSILSDIRIIHSRHAEYIGNTQYEKLN